jgi:hypothetical protein
MYYTKNRGFENQWFLKKGFMVFERGIWGGDFFIFSRAGRGEFKNN